MLDQINDQISIIKEELNSVRGNLVGQEDDILEKCRAAIRQELITLS